MLDLLSNDNGEWMTIATKLQFQRIVGLIDKQYGWSQIDPEPSKQKKNLAGDVIPKHLHTPENCQLYGCTKLEDELKK